MKYYNTTHETGNDLKEFISKASTQDQRVLDIFKRHKEEYSASQLWHMLTRDCPLTSIRRSLSNLKNKGAIVKTNNKIIGIYGRNEYKYKLI